MKPWDVPVVDVLRVIDGDTVQVRVDVGWRVEVRVTVRLVTVDTPERGQAGYDEATRFVGQWLHAGGFGPMERPLLLRDLRLASYGKVTFDRWLADLYDAETGESLSAALLAAGHAEVWR